MALLCHNRTVAMTVAQPAMKQTWQEPSYNNQWVETQYVVRGIWTGLIARPLGKLWANNYTIIVAHQKASWIGASTPDNITWDLNA